MGHRILQGGLMGDPSLLVLWRQLKHSPIAHEGLASRGPFAAKLEAIRRADWYTPRPEGFELVGAAKISRITDNEFAGQLPVLRRGFSPGAIGLMASSSHQLATTPHSFLRFTSLQCLEGVDGPTDLAPKCRFIAAEAIQCKIGQICQT